MPTTKEDAMNWDQLKGPWHDLTEQLKTEWARLTYDDFKYVAGRKRQLAGKPQERSDLLTDGGRKQIDA